MASQVSHIVYADKYLKKFPSNFDRFEFMLGCIFPDVRRIDKTIKRKDTHMKFKRINTRFEDLSSFEAGWKFHLYCDMKREDILNKYGFYSLRHATDFWHLPAKLLEDEISYDEKENWKELIDVLCNPPQIDTGIDVSRETFDLWYAINAKYFERKPCIHSMSAFLSKQEDLVKISSEIIKSVENLKKDDRVVNTLRKVAEEII